MENRDWYEQYQEQNQDTTPQRYSGNTSSYSAFSQKRSRRKGIRIGTLILCMLCAAVLGAGGGIYYARSYVDHRIASVPSGTSAIQDTYFTAKPVSISAAPVFEQKDGIVSLTKAQVIELCAPAVVGISTETPVSGYYTWFGTGSSGYTAKGAGSGIVLTSDGYIITCEHVVSGATSIKVILNDDTEYDATVVGTDPRNDLAMLKIDASGLTPATLGDSDMLTVGEDAIAIGNPLGELRGTATSGIISALNREVTVENTKMTLIQTDAAISPGNSGGGLFNSSGCLIGIVNAKASGSNSEGLGFAIPVNSVRQIIYDLKDQGYVSGRAYLGVQTQNVTLQSGYNGWGNNGFFGNFYGTGGTNCVMISRVVPGSAAEKAGIEAGDLLMAIDDQTISSNADLTNIISNYNANDNAVLTIQRNGKELKLDITFGEYTK